MKKQHKVLLLLSVITIFIVFLSIGFDQLFGSTSDWLGQHIMFPDYFRKLFYETKNILPNYALNVGGGQNIFYLSYYGFLSPYILIAYLLPFINMTYYLIGINIIMVIASGYLCYRWLMNNRISFQISLVSAIIFLLINSLLFHAHRQIMFVNYMPFLMLSLIGIDKYFSHNKKGLYIISVFLMIMTSYYYSVGGLIVLVIYGIFKYLEINKKITLKNFIIDGFKFLLPMLLGVLLSSILLIPTVFAILYGRGDGVNVAFSLKDLFLPTYNINALVYNNYGIGFTSIAVIALVIGLFSKENRKLSIVLIILISIPIFSYILNGLLYIRDKVLIPFAPLFIILISSLFSNLEHKKITLKQLLIIVIGAISLSLIFNYNNIWFYVDIILNLILLSLYLIKDKKIIAYVGIVLIALTSNVIVNQNETYVSKEQYNELFNNSQEELIKKTIDSDGSFYRFNNLVDNTSLTINKVYDLRYYQTSLYSSTNNSYYYNFFNEVMNNAAPYRNAIMLAQSDNIMFQTLMGVKYILTDHDAPIGYHLVDHMESFSIYKNDNVFPLGYASKSLINKDDFEKLSYPYSVEALLKGIVIDKKVNSKLNTHIETLDVEYDYELDDNIKINNEGSKIIVDAKETSNINLNLKEALENKILLIKFKVIDAPNCKDGDISIKINNVTNKLTCKQWIYFNNNHNFEYTISSNDPISEVNIEFSKGHFEISGIEVFMLDYQYVESIKNDLDIFNVDMSKTKGDKIVGNINVTEDGYFATTIPYDKGFTILVNGEDIEYEMVNQSFIGFPINKGNYDIEISYKSPGINLGKALSFSSLIVLIIILYREKKHKI